MSRVLVAGMGNVLRRDDGFGVEVAQRLTRSAVLPGEVKIIEVGIGGVHLVQELMDGYEALVIIDAVEGAARLAPCTCSKPRWQTSRCGPRKPAPIS